MSEESSVTIQREEFDVLLDAARWARFYLHVEVPAAARREDWESYEIGAEVATDLAEALVPFRPDEPACKGCSGTNVWASSPREFVAARAVTSS